LLADGLGVRAIARKLQISLGSAHKAAFRPGC
jgi:hypothetical protein